MKSRAEIDEYLGASGWRTTRSGDLPLLDLCADACPHGLRVGEETSATHLALGRR